jgi:CheY-like chemotaxis protein
MRRIASGPSFRQSSPVARPTLLVAEPEPDQALSTRKLVLETGKFNVITAHSGGEFLELLKRFPQIDAAIVHGELRDVPCEEMLKWVKQVNPRAATIFLAAIPGSNCKGADQVISSHQPEALLARGQRNLR